MKNKILVTIMAMFAAVSLNAGQISVSTDATYYTKFLNKGVVAFDDAVIAAVNVDGYGFVGGVKAYNTIQSNAVGKTVQSSGLFKRTDLSLGYKFTSPLANLTFGNTYIVNAKSVSNAASVNEPFVTLDGKLWKNSVWNITGRADLKNHTNNVETNVSLPFGFQKLKVVPSIGYGFNDPSAATIAAFKDAKQYALVGLGLGYYTKLATINVGVYQARDSLLTAGNTKNGVSAGLAVKF